MSDIYLSLTETPTVVTLSQPVVSGVLSSNVTVTNVVSVNVVTMPAITVQAAAPSVTTVAGSVAVSNFPSVTTVAGTVALDANSLSALENVTVTVGAAVSVSNFPSTQTIAGTVTANVKFSADLTGADIPPPSQGIALGYLTDNQTFFAPVHEDQGLPVRIAGNSQTQTIAGTVTANAVLAHAQPIYELSESNADRCILIGTATEENGQVFHTSPDNPMPISGTVTIGSSVTIGSLPAISGTVTANLFGEAVGGGPNEPTKLQCDSNGFLITSLYRSGSDAVNYDPVAGNVSVNVKNVSSVTIGSLPRVTLIDGSGTVATANTAITVFASSSTRSYLLVQVTTGSAFVNVGATATTVNGINLTAGQGYSWETTIPQGIVSLISTTTNSRYVAKEA